MQCLPTLVLLLLSLAPAIAAEPAGLRVYGVPALHKVLPEEAPGPGCTEGRAAIECARDEGESFQVVVRAGRPVEDVSLVVEDLRGPKGASLRPEVRKVEWVDVAVPCDPKDPAGPPDLRPDPLPPVDPARDRFALQPGRNLAFWFTIRASADARAGTYAGRVRFLAAGKPLAEVRVEARVRAFTLPRRPTLQSMVGLADSNLYRVHGAKTPEEKEQVIRLYFEEYIRARLSPFLYAPATLAFGPLPNSQIRWEFEVGADGAPTGGLKIDFAGFDREGARYLDGRNAFSAFNFAPYLIMSAKDKPPTVAFTDSKGVRVLRLKPDGTVDPVFERLVVAFFRQVAAHLAEKGWLDRAVYYVWDEPSDQHIEPMKIVASLVRQADPRIRTAITYDPAQVPRLRELEENGRSLISLWIPYVTGYRDAVAAEQRGKGADYWLYDVSSYCLISHSGEQNRAVFWDVWRRDAHGYLYYLTTWWGQESVWNRPSFLLPQFTYRYQHGDGYFFYPPERSATTEKPILDRLVPTVRWELMREGVEDYEYLRLLERLLAGAERARPAGAPLRRAVERARAALGKARALADQVSLASTSYSIRDLKFDAANGWSFGLEEGWLHHAGGKTADLRITLPDVKDGRYLLQASAYHDPAYRGKPYSRFRVDGQEFATPPSGSKGGVLVSLCEVDARGGTCSFTLSPVEDAGVIFYRVMLKRSAGLGASSLPAVRREIADAIEALLAAGAKEP